MYSVIVTQDVQDLATGVVTSPRGRFSEYTEERIRTQLSSLSNEAIDCLCVWPCLLLEEGRGDESAYLAKISTLRQSGSDLVATVELIDTDPGLINDTLWRLREQLDLEQFEFSRQHWAVKDRDLLQVLGTVAEVSAADTARFSNAPLPAPTRSEVLAARDVISEWGHTEIDDLLLEIGVEGLTAGREIGSRRDRANGILSFALENQGALTAENYLLSRHLVRVTGSFVAPSVTPGAPVSPDAEVSSPTPRVAVERPRRSPNRVFVVHGQDQATRDNVVAFLTELELVPIVLHDQPNMGRHLLTKFIDEADLVTFAVVVMTGDDVGGARDSELRSRARQNVILELGYFLAHLGQARVCALVTPGLETPSDFDGIVYILVDDTENWKRELLRELEAAGMPIS